MRDREIKKIMYIEDEPDILAIAQIALEDIGGFTMLGCNDSFAAVNMALEFKPDLILIDVMLPGMDGPTIFLELAKHPSLANIPVIFMTAKSQESEINEYLELGALDVIIKPFDPLTLAALINKIWDARYGR